MAHYRKPLAAAAALNTAIFVVEAVAGFQADSLSLLMDSVHNLSDEMALVFLYLAFVLPYGISRGEEDVAKGNLMTEHFDYRKLSDRDFAEQRLREGRELEERDAEWARAKRQRQREEQRTRRSEVDALRDELRAEIDVLRRDCDARYDVQMKAIGEVIGETVERADDAIKKVQNELFALVERRFGELIGRLEAIAPGALKDPARGKDFRFAGERDDCPIDLPNPLRRRELN